MSKIQHESFPVTKEVRSSLPRLTKNDESEQQKISDGFEIRQQHLLLSKGSRTFHSGVDMLPGHLP